MNGHFIDGYFTDGQFFKGNFKILEINIIVDWHIIVEHFLMNISCVDIFLLTFYR